MKSLWKANHVLINNILKLIQQKILSEREELKIKSRIESR